MSFATGTRLEFFEIVDLLGAGGMGEVYRARDTRLNRDVAIKVLPDALAADPERLARFQREAQVLAALSHPNIGVIHGIHETSSTRFLVLELVEGETLASRLKRGPVPVDEALELLKQVAAALEAAHEKGILHRDLKPANIQITPAGVAKVLDFGLAKMLQTEAAPADPSNSPTLGSGQTMGGAILGTAAYMSPEQARGRTVDKRTDVWAFGCVAYEMLTGQPAFAGETVADILVSVMKSEPDWSRLPSGTPFALRAMLRQCLNKQARNRLHEIADARVAIEDALVEPSMPQTVPTTKAPDRRLMASGLAAFVLIGAALGWLATRKPADIPETLRFQMSLQPAEVLTGTDSSIRPSRTAVAIHPNGKMIVFAGDTKGTPAQLYARELTQPDAVPIPGTEGANGPFFSPDGQWIGFYSKGQIKKVPVGGGPAVVLCAVNGSQGLYGASWAEDGTIFFSDRGRGIFKVPSGGGTPAMVTTSDSAKGEEHLLPQVLPGGKALIFTSVTAGEWDRARIVVQSLGTGERRELIQGGEDARYAPTGHLLFMKRATLMAVPFDLPQLRVSGEPVALLEGLMQSVNTPNSISETGSGQFALSNTGTLVYVTGGMHPLPESSVLWVDRKGGAEPVSWAPPRPYRSPRLSPDQNKVILTVSGAGAGRMVDVWVFDTLRGAPTRLTFSGFNWPALWSPDGKRVVFSSDKSGVNNLYIANADGSGQIERLTTSDHTQLPSSWSSKNNSITFLENRGTNQIWVLPMDGDRTPKLFLESRFDLFYPEFSPDGRWIAYVSPESGNFEVYVQPYPGPGEKHRVSTDGGSQPIWTADGRELLFRGNSQSVWAATITSLNPFRNEAPRLLFQPSSGGFSSTTPVRSWDATPDGQRFMFTRDEPSKDKPVAQLQIVLHWDRELLRRVPAK